MTSDDKRLANLRPFKKGEGGRPKGSRNKLGEAFLEELYQDFEANGPAAIVRCRQENPAVYLKVIASIIPKQLHLGGTGFEDMTDADLERRIQDLDRILLSDRQNGDGDNGPH